MSDKTSTPRTLPASPIAWVRMLNDEIDWEQDCLYSDPRHFDEDAYPAEDGYTCVPICLFSEVAK